MCYKKGTFLERDDVDLWLFLLIECFLGFSSHPVPKTIFSSKKNKKVDEMYSKKPILFCKHCVYFYTFNPQLQVPVTDDSRAPSSRGPPGVKRFSPQMGISSNKHQTVFKLPTPKENLCC